MKKRSFIFTLIIALFVAVFAFGCGETVTPESPFKDYTDFTGADAAEMIIDEEITLDGILTEDVWANCQNSIYWKSTDTRRTMPDGSLKDMTVHTYFGENAIYVAFEVKDCSVFYNRSRRQSRNTGVELYFAPIDKPVHGEGNWSVRVSPTTKDPVVGYYQGDKGGDYSEVKFKNRAKAAAVVDGTINEGDRDDNGYTVELAISYDFFPEKLDAYQFTAAFVQVGSYDRDERYANTFIPGTGHLSPSGWKAISNEGAITDKGAIMDKNVVADEFMTIDGVLDEAQWIDAIENNKGKSITATAYNATYTTYTVMTDLGLYIGLDSTEKHVYYDERVAKYNTGAEIFIVPNGDTFISSNAVQFRFNVGGVGERWVGNGNGWGTGYFPAVSKGSVKNGVINSSDTDGWQGEIFIPWEGLNVTEQRWKEEIAIYANYYYAPASGIWENINNNAQANAAGWRYLNPTGYSNQNVNAYEKFFRFTKEGGFTFNDFAITTEDLDTSTMMPGASIIANNADLADKIDATKNYYYTEHNVTIGSIALLSGFTTNTSSEAIGTIEKYSDIETEIVYEYLGSNSYRVYIPADATALEEFSKDATLTYINNAGGRINFNIGYDEYMSVNGKITSVDTLNGYIAEENKAKFVNKLGPATVNNNIWVVPEENAIYATAIISDVNASANRGKSSLDLAITLGELSKDDTIMVRVYASGVVEAYTFNQYTSKGKTTPWKFDDELTSKIKAGALASVTGYVVEVKIPWSVFGLEEKVDVVYAAPSVNMVANATAGVSHGVYGNKVMVLNHLHLDKANYLAFDYDGFVPNAIYAIEEVTFVDGANLDGDNYVADVAVSYVPFGGMATDTTATLTLARSAVEALDIDAKNNGLALLTVDGFTADVKVSYVKPDATAFDATKIKSYVSFDNGAEDIVATSYVNGLVSNNGTAFVSDGDYAGDMAFVANMKQRSVKIPADISTENFTVSMTIDANALNAYDTDTNGFMLFATSNVSASSGLAVSYSPEFGFQVKTPLEKATATLAIDSTKLRGTVNLTVSVNRKDGKFTFFVNGEELGFITTKYTGGYGVVNSKVLGIGGSGTKAEDNYLDRNILIDDFVLYDGTLDKQGVFDMCAYVATLGENTLFTTDVKEIKYNFNNLLDTDADKVTTINVTAPAGAEITVGGGWADFAEANGTVITATMGKADMLTAMATPSYYAVNGFKKYINIEYVEVGEITAEANVTEIWKKPNYTGNYEVEVYVQSNGIGVENGVTFAGAKLGDLESEVLGGGYYKVYISAVDLGEAMKEEIVATANGNTISLEIAFKQLSASVINDLIQNSEAYYNFDGNVTNLLTDEDALVAARFSSSTEGYAVYADDDTAYVANMHQRTLRISGLTLGTDSFTVSTLINGKDLIENTVNGSGHASILFGTGDVDYNGAFSVRIKADGSFQIKVGSSYWPDSTNNRISIANLEDKYYRFTFVFDRETAGTLKFMLYLDGEVIYSKSGALTGSLDSVAGDKLFGIGSAGTTDGGTGSYTKNRGTANIRFGDFLFYRGVMTTAQMNGFDNYIDEIVAGASWRVNDVEFDYSTVTEGQAVALNIAPVVTENFGGDVSTATLDLDYAYANGVLVIPYENIDEFIGGAEVTMTIDGVSKTFKITYYPLEAVYTDLEAIEIWKESKVGDNYAIDATIYVNEEMTKVVADTLSLTFKANDTTITANYLGNGKYQILVPATIVEAGEAVTVTISAGEDLKDASFVATHKALSDETVAKLAAGTKIYMDFEDDLVDAVSDAKTSAWGTVTYVDGVNGKGAKLTPKTGAIDIPVALGSDSFTISFDVLIDTKNWSNMDNFFEIISSLNPNKEEGGNYFDGANNTFQISGRGNQNTFRIQPGRNTAESGDKGDGKPSLYYDNCPTAGQWQRITLVITRDVETGEWTKSGARHKIVDGKVVYTGSDADTAEWVDTERATLELYLNGELAESRNLYYTTDQVLGTGTLSLGGSYGRLNANYGRNNELTFDNFLFYSGAMNAEEVRGLASYYGDIVELNKAE